MAYRGNASYRNSLAQSRQPAQTPRQPEQTLPGKIENPGFGSYGSRGMIENPAAGAGKPSYGASTPVSSRGMIENPAYPGGTSAPMQRDVQPRMDSPLNRGMIENPAYPGGSSGLQGLSPLPAGGGMGEALGPAQAAAPARAAALRRMGEAFGPQAASGLQGLLPQRRQAIEMRWPGGDGGVQQGMGYGLPPAPPQFSGRIAGTPIGSRRNGSSRGSMGRLFG